MLYADKVTDSMQRAISVTEVRRAKQEEHNAAHGIVPRTILKPVRDLIVAPAEDEEGDAAPRERAPRTRAEAEARVKALRAEMFAAAKDLDFEKAAKLRDELLRLEALALEFDP